MRWLDLSSVGMAIAVREQSGQRSLVLQSLPGSPAPDADKAARLGFEPIEGLLVRRDTRLSLNQVREVFPSVAVREFADSEIRFVPPAKGAPIEQGTLQLSSEERASAEVVAAPERDASEFEPLLPAHQLTREAFIQKAHLYQSLGGWHVRLRNEALPVPDVARVMPPKTPAAVVLGRVHRHVVELQDRADPSQSRVEVLAQYPNLLKGEAWYSNRGAEQTVARLLGKLGVLDRMMHWVRLGDGRTDHCRLVNPPYQDLAVEVHPGHGEFEQLVYLTHYRDDGQPDGEMVFGVRYGRLWLTETAVQSFRGELRGCDRRFAFIFARNLLQQGFDEAKIEWSRDDASDREYAEPAPALRPAIGS